MGLHIVGELLAEAVYIHESMLLFWVSGDGLDGNDIDGW